MVCFTKEAVARSGGCATGTVTLSFRHPWSLSLRRAGTPYFRLYHLRSTYATPLSAGGVADAWVTQLPRQDDSAVFKKHSQIKLQMKREALQQLNHRANELGSRSAALAQKGVSIRL